MIQRESVLPNVVSCGNHRFSPHLSCQEIGNLMCGRCMSFHYCSGACQRENWKIHKLICNDLKIKRDAYLSGVGIAGAVKDSGELTKARSTRVARRGAAKSSTKQSAQSATKADKSATTTLPSTTRKALANFQISSGTLREVWAKAVAAYKADNNALALLQYQETLSIAESLYGCDHTVCAEIHMSLGHTYMAMW